MFRNWIGIIKRGLKKPPKVIAQRIFAEIAAETGRFYLPYRSRRLDEVRLLKNLGASTIDGIWNLLGNNPSLCCNALMDKSLYGLICPGDSARIFYQADNALIHKVDLLGSGLTDLGAKIDWHKDYKSGYGWLPLYFRDIDYVNLDRPSDVKFPWEVSRMQWLIPAGQAYILTGDEKYALSVKDVISDWIDANPYACSINWACTMEVALRILSWTWFFHVFKNCEAWSEHSFRVKFLTSLYLHGDFTERHLERSDINGNHFTADAAGLVFAGLFFGNGKAPEKWRKLGWNILSDEISRQVFSDGVDYEASVPYHRLVMELFLLPAIYLGKYGLKIPEFYKQRIISMARFTAAYSRPDGTIPLWGDADDARALPFGSQPINDHRYLVEIVGTAWDIPELKQYAAGSRSETFWLLGPDVVHTLNDSDRAAAYPPSQSFSHAGFYIMRNKHDHVFIDCGPVGLAGRGGHGHNDCLSFEAILDGEHLISDCGAYVYTSSFEDRNNFRSTAYHNTPQIDGEEINRFIRPDYLWNLHNDAEPQLKQWHTAKDRDIFVGSHTGYQRLIAPVLPQRTIVLDHHLHALIMHDSFTGVGDHTIAVPLHLAPQVAVEHRENGRLVLKSKNHRFTVFWKQTSDWDLSITGCRISPSYGILVRSNRICWKRTGSLPNSLTICILPLRNASEIIVQECFNNSQNL